MTAGYAAFGRLWPVRTVFKTGERCAAALAGWISVRLRHPQAPDTRRRRGAASQTDIAGTWMAIDCMIVQPPVGTLLARRGTIAATASAAAAAISGTTEVYTSRVKALVLVPEHLLHDLDVHPGREAERGRCRAAGRETGWAAGPPGGRAARSAR